MRGYLQSSNETMTPLGKSADAACGKMTEDKLWFEYKMKKSIQAREELILRYAPLVKIHAGQLASTGVHTDYEECLSYGILGLIDAIDRFNPDFDISFKYYAAYRIRGSIIDGMRKMGRIPDFICQNVKRIEKATQKLFAESGSMPSDNEIADALEISLEKYNEWVQDIACSIPLSLDTPVNLDDEGEAITLLDTLADSREKEPLAIAEKQELKRVLAAAIDSLTETERLVLTLYYYEELTLKEIGMILDITESRVSQIHTKTILKLRGRLRSPAWKERL
jgi:RNA polymerase sigma factor for flagellar operon FliA